jgi:two-component system, chemotaxis family, protein-glutamate methylesterase/glutaminase
VLIVDDSRFTRRIIRLLLADCDEFDAVGEAEDGEEGLQKFRELSPDLITLDLDMPRLDGLGMLQRLRLESDVPVIIVSAFPAMAEDFLEDRHDMHVEGLVNKTFSDRSYDFSVFRAELIFAMRTACGLTVPQ